MLAADRASGVHWKLFADLSERAGDDEIPVSGAETVGDALDALLDGRERLAERVRDDDGGVVDDVNVLRNGANVFETGDGLEEPVDDDDELALFPPVSGG